MSQQNEDLEKLYSPNARQKKIGKGKRILSFLIDFLFILLVFFPLSIFVSKPIITSFSSDSIAKINEVAKEIYEENNLPYMTNKQNYNLIEIDYDSFIIMTKQENPTYTDEKINDLYFESYRKSQELIQSKGKYIDNYSVFYIKYLFINSITMLIPIFINYFLIPLLNKKRKSIGSFITKTSLVNVKDNNPISQVKVLLRFIFIFIVEFLLLYSIFNTYFFIVYPLMQIIFMLPTKNNYEIHDIVTRSIIIEDQYVGLIEE